MNWYPKSISHYWRVISLTFVLVLACCNSQALLTPDVSSVSPTVVAVLSTNTAIPTSTILPTTTPTPIPPTPNSLSITSATANRVINKAIVTVSSLEIEGQELTWAFNPIDNAVQMVMDYRTLVRYEWDTDSLITMAEFDTWIFAVHPSGMVVTGECTELLRNVCIETTLTVRNDTITKSFTVAGEVYRPTFSPLGTYLIAPTLDQKVNIWNLDSGATLFEIDGNELDTILRSTEVQFSPDEHFMIVLESSNILDDESPAKITLFDLVQNSSKVIVELPSAITDVVFSPDNSLIAYATKNRMYIYDITQLANIQEIYSARETPTKLVFSPDGSLLATAGCDTRGSLFGCIQHGVVLWDVATGAQLARMSANNSALTDLIFSPDGRAIISMSASGCSFCDHETELARWELGDEIVHEAVVNSEPVISFDPTEALPLPYQELVINNLENGAIHYWLFEGNMGDKPVVVVGSTQFNTVAQLLDSDGHILAEGQDVGLFNSNDYISSYVLPENGIYTVAVTASGNDETGEYGILWYWRSTEAIPTISYGQTVTSTLIDGAVGGWYFDGIEGDIATITMSSNDFNTQVYLQVSDAGYSGFFFEENNNISNSDRNSQIAQVELPYTGRYLILADMGTGGNDGMGIYTLELVKEND